MQFWGQTPLEALFDFIASDKERLRAFIACKKGFDDVIKMIKAQAQDI